MSFVKDAVSGIFGGDEQILQPAPTVAPVMPMPEPDDAAVGKAKKKSMLAQRRRTGRESTILSDDTDSLG